MNRSIPCNTKVDAEGLRRLLVSVSNVTTDRLNIGIVKVLLDGLRKLACGFLAQRDTFLPHKFRIKINATWTFGCSEGCYDLFEYFAAIHFPKIPNVLFPLEIRMNANGYRS